MMKLFKMILYIVLYYIMSQNVLHIENGAFVSLKLLKIHVPTLNSHV